ncbi:MAG: transaldolase family protein [Peptococcaceae bacterium]
MLILVDGADPVQIARLWQYYPLDGVTTNPTLIAKEKKEFWGLLKAIQDIIGRDKMLHVQVTGLKGEEMVEEALYLKEKIGGNLYLKIPVIAEGIKAIRILKAYSIKVTATAVFTPMQALMAAKAGADFIAPYVNRLDNICSDGIGAVEEILKIMDLHQFAGRVVAASFKNVEQINRLCLKGVHAVTLNPELIEQLLFHPMTDLSVAGFRKDWEDFFGTGQSISHLEQ